MTFKITTNNEIFGKRIILSVGINTYESVEIPKLSGAENDAKEIFDLLAVNGGFEKDYRYLITGEAATYKNIMTFISQIFREDREYDLGLFYFSGHGFMDKNNELYLATFDVNEKDPIVCGIKIKELKDIIYSSKNKKNTVLILDCCYSGAATEVLREIKFLRI